MSIFENWVRGMEAAAFTLFFILIAALTWNLWIKMPAVWILLAGAMLGWLAGDLVSGLVHCFCDDFFKEDSPKIRR